MREILGLTCLVLALAAPPAWAQASAEPGQAPGISLYVEDKEELRTKHYKQRWVFPDVLGHDATGKPYLKPFVAPNAEAKSVIDLLDPGVSFATPKVRDEIATVLDTFPAMQGQHGPGA